MDGLSSICAGLGTLQEDDDGNRIGYEKGEYCSDNLKDLLRFLRRDEPEKRDVFKQVCRWNIAGKDLIPIIEYCHEDRNLTLNAVKILVFLTMPVEPTSTDIPQQMEYLWGLKSAITFSNTVPMVVSLLESPLENLDNESFTEDDWKLVQLVLTLFRNILAIQDISPQQKAGGSASQFLSLRDKFLELLFEENVMDIIIALSQHTGGSHGYLRQDNLLLLEIFYYIFKGQDPELIAKMPSKGSKVEEDDENSMSSLHSLMKEEQEKRKLAELRNLNCYSQLSGTYTRVTLDGFRAVFKGNPCSVSGDILRKSHRSYRGPSKRTIWDHGQLPSMKNQILEFLNKFMSQFLIGGYNVLMRSIREDIDKEHQEIQSSDIIVFFHVAQFVTTFHYYKSLTSKSRNVAEKEAVTSDDEGTLVDGCICGPVSETLNESMFLMVISKWRYAFEGLKQTNDHKLLSTAGSLVKTMIRMLDLVLKESPEDSSEPRIARALLYKLFYDQTEEGMTHFLFNMIKSFDTHKQSKSELSNLVETIHVILRLMENLQARGSIRVSKKARKRKAKKTMTKKETVCEPSADSATRNEVHTSTCEPSDKVNLLEKKTITATDFIKGSDKSLEDSDKVPASMPGSSESTQLDTEGRVVDDNDDDLYVGTDDSSDDEQLVLTDEVDFKVSSLVSALANNTVLQKLCWLLKYYRSNSISTNHFILSILRRICDDLELSPMLYQLSILTIFYEILEEQTLRPCKEYETIVTFLTSFVRRMLRKIKNYPLLSVEILFWKTRKECNYISCGSMLNELNCMKNKIRDVRGGTTDSGNPFAEVQKWARRNIADALGDDDFEEAHEELQKEDDPSEAKFQIIKQSSVEGNESINSILKKRIYEGVTSDREEHFGEEGLGRVPKGGADPVLDDELQSKLYDLYETFKDNSDCFQLIAGELDPTGNISIEQISNALKQLPFKLPAKSKMRNSDALNQLKHSHTDLPMDTMQPGSSSVKKISSLVKPIHSRKRVQAFSIDQEQKIKELFEQFKDQKRCSYMIANELDHAGKISAAQVSRKLKQLGLVLHKTNRFDAAFQLRDKGSSDMSLEGAGESDDETLLSLRNRSKYKPNGNYNEKHRKLVRKSSEGTVDDELLSSILVKKKKMPEGSDEEQFTTQATETNMVENNIQFRDIRVSERDEIDAAKITKSANHSSNSESGTVGLYIPDASESKCESPNTSLDSLVDDELVDLVDFDENTVSVSEPGYNVVRRRSRMVIDFEDDD